MWPLLFAASIGLQAFSSYQQGQTQAEEYAYKEQEALYKAKVAEADAKALQRKTTFEQQRQIQEAAAAMGTMRVRQGTSGAQTDVGSPVIVRAQQWAEFELENFLIGLEGRTEKSKKKSEAAFETIQAGQYAKAAKRSVLSGLLGAGANVLTGVSSGYEKGYWGAQNG
jgi:hypothetical protein